MVAVVPVAARLSTRLLASAAGAKRAEMMAPADAERLTGYVTGGISPFGMKRRMEIVSRLDRPGTMTPLRCREGCGASNWRSRRMT